MSQLLVSSPDIPTLGELLDRLSGVSAERVRYYPLPGTATVTDVVDIHARERRLYELVDGVLVEKSMGWKESIIAGAILAALRAFVVPRRLGYVSGEAGMVRLLPDLLRMPDVAFVSRRHAPIADEPAPLLAPDLVVEVLSMSNTAREMDRKRREYFGAGTRLMWSVDPRVRIVTVYTSPEDPIVVPESGILNGSDVLPGFTLPLAPLFAEWDEAVAIVGERPE